MDTYTFRRLMGHRDVDPRDRMIAERRAHQFSDSIGGDSSNYMEPKFGTTPGTRDNKTQPLKRD